VDEERPGEGLSAARSFAPRSVGSLPHAVAASLIDRSFVL
jgi:hypothetical protein